MEVKLEDLSKDQLVTYVIELREKIESMEKDVNFLHALEASGVDNWDWYGHAWRMANGDGEDDDE